MINDNLYLLNKKTCNLITKASVIVFKKFAGRFYYKVLTAKNSFIRSSISLPTAATEFASLAAVGPAPAAQTVKSAPNTAFTAAATQCTLLA